MVQSNQDGNLGEELEGQKVGSKHRGAGQAGSRRKSGDGAPSSVSNCQEEPLVSLWASAFFKYLLINLTISCGPQALLVEACELLSCDMWNLVL